MTTPRVSAALEELRAALLEELLGTISSTLSSNFIPDSAAARGRRAPAPVRSAAATPILAPRAKGAKRTQADIEAQAKAVLAFLKKNPGSRAEHISKGTGIVSKDLPLVINKLLEEKAISKKGQRRATSYTVR